MTTSFCSPLEVLVRLNNGHSARFLQADPQVARALLETLQADRIFTQGQLLIAEGETMMAYPCSAIEQVDLVCESLPDWPLHQRMLNIRELAREDFPQNRHGEGGYPTEQGFTLLYLEVEMSSGRRIYLELRSEPMAHETLTGNDLGRTIQHFFQPPPLQVQRIGGGVTLVNPVNIVRILSYSTPMQIPQSAWRAQYAPEESDWSWGRGPGLTFGVAGEKRPAARQG